MWLIQEDLEKDGWHYIGGQDPMEHIPMDGDPEDFLKAFQKETKKLRKLNVNMIRSREQYSALFQRHPWMYERLHDILSEDWEVLIVAGYRPYFSWVPSWWFQTQRMPYSNPDKPEERHMNPWTKKNSGELYRIEPMFPEFYNWWKVHTRYTDAIVELAKPYFRVKVYDIYNPRGARTHFLCDIIGKEFVPHACQKSIELDQNPPKRVNKGNLNEVQYDAIALEMAARGMVDLEKWDRATVVDEITVYQEEELRRTVLDFPYKCPDQAHMDELWNMSRSFDLEYMPELSKEDPNRLDKLHEQFMEAVEKKKFCHVDVEAILADSEWQEHFQKFAVAKDTAATLRNSSTATTDESTQTTASSNHNTKLRLVQKPRFVIHCGPMKVRATDGLSQTNLSTGNASCCSKLAVSLTTPFLSC